MRVIRRCAWAVLPAFAGLASLSWHCESVLFKPSEALYDQAADPGSGGEAHATQRLSQAPDFYRADYGFQNFNGDLLHIGYQAPRRAYDSYCAGFWYSRGFLNTLSGPAIDAYLASRGFKRLSADVISADVPAMIRRSSGPLKALSSAFDRIAVQKGYDSENLIGSVAAMVQTAIRFQIPPLEAKACAQAASCPRS